MSGTELAPGQPADARVEVEVVDLDGAVERSVDDVRFMHRAPQHWTTWGRAVDREVDARFAHRPDDRVLDLVLRSLGSGDSTMGDCKDVLDLPHRVERGHQSNWYK